MNRRGSEDGREVPSIIEEIVIYDKPNKPLVPHEIFPQSTQFALGQGDIVLSRVKNVSVSNPSSSRVQESDFKISKAIKERQFKCEPVEITKEDIESEFEDDDEFSEMRDKKLDENNLLYKAACTKPNLKLVCTDDDLSEPEESIENISKEIYKTNIKSFVEAGKQSKKNVKKTLKLTTESFRTKVNTKIKPDAIKPTKKVKEVDIQNKKSAKTESRELKRVENSPFKKPRGRPKKLQATPQKPKLEKVVIKNVKKENLEADKESDETEESTIDQSSSDDTVQGNDQVNEVTENNEVRQKRVRRRPKKYDDEEMIVQEILLGESGEDATLLSPLKKKQYAELTIVPLYTEDVHAEMQVNTDNLDDLLNSAQEQVRTLNEVEAELQSLVEGGQLPQKSVKNKKLSGKGTKKNPAKKSKKTEKRKVTEMLTQIKKEVEEENTNLVDVAYEEAYESDDDSRKEWLPEEYAEYKKQHVMKMTNKMHKCKFCGSEFATYYGLRKHRALEHDDVGKDIKESTFETSEEVDDVDGESDEESRGEWMPQDYAEYKMKHKTKRSQWYKCKICCAVFSNYYKLSKHRVEHENKPNPYECKQCDARFIDIDSLTAHIRVHQGKDPYKCKKCEQGFQTKEDLIAHMPIHILKKPPAVVKRYRCDICSKEFSKLCDIERHTRVHTGEKPAECNICHKRFQQAHNLSKHLLIHLHVKPFQCEICHKKFGRVDVLNRHLLTHSMEKPYKCELCNKGFIRQVQLDNHIERFHPDVDLESMGLGVTSEVSVTHVV